MCLAWLPALSTVTAACRYYLKYQNKRPEYVAALWLPSARAMVTNDCVLLQVNWEQVNSNYQAAKGGKVPEVL